MPTHELMLPGEAASALRVSVRTIQNYARAGRIRCIRLSPGAHRYVAADIQALLNGESPASPGLSQNEAGNTPAPTIADRLTPHALAAHVKGDQMSITTSRPNGRAIHTQQADDILIEELDIGVRSYNCLRRARIQTVGDLVSKTASELNAIPN